MPTGPISRRDYLKAMAGAAATPLLARSSLAAAAPLPTLPTLPASDAELLLPGTARYTKFQVAYNLRTIKAPRLRALCKTPQGVAAVINWSRDNQLPFALRAGGHSYEGFSQSEDVAIDVGQMNHIDIANATMTVGAGCGLGDIYAKINAAGFAFPGGSCETVGVTGHALGGGFGFMGRPFGLACDNLEWAELVDAKGNIVTADAQNNASLFWALRGGGGGSFGAVTRMRFTIHKVQQIVHFSVSWKLNPASAVKLMQAWQAWAPQAPANLTTVLVLANGGKGRVALTCSGQSPGSTDEVRHELAKLTKVAAATPTITVSSRQVPKKPVSGWAYPALFQKAKSDYVKSPMSEDGMATLFREMLKSPSVGAICDAYGGAVGSVAADATAFGHRDMLYSIQYFINWTTTAAGKIAVARIDALYAAMRPFVSGAAYVNYPDVDLPDYPTAYWGANLPRLKQIKVAVDPNNVFRHAQSVPLA